MNKQICILLICLSISLSNTRVAFQGLDRLSERQGLHTLLMPISMLWDLEEKLPI